MVVQRDVEENATVANVLQVFHMAELLHWAYGGLFHSCHEMNLCTVFSA